MEFNLPATITAAVAFAAIISPILTALINNHYLLKLKKMELKQREHEQTVLYKRNIFENYLRYLSVLVQQHDATVRDKYAEYYPLAYMYVSSEVREKMSYVNKILDKSVDTDLIDDIDDLANEMYKTLQLL